MTDISPCPFDGAPAMVIVAPDTKRPRVQCVRCGADQGEFERKADAIAAWNHRVALPSPPQAGEPREADPLAPDEREAARLRDITGRLHRLQRNLKMPMKQAALAGIDGAEPVSVSYGELWWLSYYADTLQGYVSAKVAPTPPEPSAESARDYTAAPLGTRVGDCCDEEDCPGELALTLTCNHCDRTYPASALSMGAGTREGPVAHTYGYPGLPAEFVGRLTPEAVKQLEDAGYTIEPLYRAAPISQPEGQGVGK